MRGSDTHPGKTALELTGDGRAARWSSNRSNLPQAAPESSPVDKQSKPDLHPALLAVLPALQEEVPAAPLKPWAPQRRRFFRAGRVGCARISSASARRTVAPLSWTAARSRSPRIKPNGSRAEPVRMAVFGPGGCPATGGSVTGSPRGRRRCSRVRCATPRRGPDRRGGSPHGRSPPRRCKSLRGPRRRRVPTAPPRREHGS